MSPALKRYRVLSKKTSVADYKASCNWSVASRCTTTISPRSRKKRQVSEIPRKGKLAGWWPAAGGPRIQWQLTMDSKRSHWSATSVVMIFRVSQRLFNSSNLRKCSTVLPSCQSDKCGSFKCSRFKKTKRPAQGARPQPPVPKRRRKEKKSGGQWLRSKKFVAWTGTIVRFCSSLIMTFPLSAENRGMVQALIVGVDIRNALFSS